VRLVLAASRAPPPPRYFALVVIPDEPPKILVIRALPPSLATTREDAPDAAVPTALRDRQVRFCDALLKPAISDELAGATCFKSTSATASLVKKKKSTAAL
jgi:hypothetical protein